MVCDSCRTSDAALSRLTGELRRKDEELQVNNTLSYGHL